MYFADSETGLGVPFSSFTGIHGLINYLYCEILHTENDGVWISTVFFNVHSTYLLSVSHVCVICIVDDHSVNISSTYLFILLILHLKVDAFFRFAFI